MMAGPIRFRVRTHAVTRDAAIAKRLSISQFTVACSCGVVFERWTTMMLLVLSPRSYFNELGQVDLLGLAVRLRDAYGAFPFLN